MNSNFINSLALLIKEKYDLKKDELTVVFPNKRAAFYLRSKFKEIYHEDIWLPQMLSIEEAMTQWSGVQLVDAVDMLFELIAIDSELYSKGKSISVFGSMATQMAKDFDEIDQYGVDAEHLFSYINDLKRLGTWDLEGSVRPGEQDYLVFFENLKRYYDRLHERLDQQGKGYYGMITRRLAELSYDELVSKVRDRKVLFAGFNALTPTEQKIIDKLCKSDHAEVVWDFDHYYVDDEHNEAGLFARSYLQNDVKWKPTKLSNSLLSEKKEIHLVGANGNTIQAKALQSLLQEEKDPNVAVILADEKLMIPVLNAIPDSDRYSRVNVSMGYPLKQTSLDHFITEFFTLHRKGRKVREDGWYLWPILRILDSELLQAVFSKEEISELNRYIISIAKHSFYIYKQEIFAQYCHSQDLQEFMRLLLVDNKGKRLTGWIDSLRSLLVFLANKIQRYKQDDDMLFLLNQISEAGKVVNRLKDIMDRYPDYVTTLDELEILYRLVSSSTSIKLNGSSTTGLQLMGLLEARNLDFKTFYMIGVNEGVLPTGKSYNSFIPYNIRRECGLPDDREKQAVYAYHFYRQLQGTEKVYFIYNTNGNDNGGEPSRFLLQLKHELAAKNPQITIVEEVFANITEPSTPPHVLSINKNDDVMALVIRKLQPNSDDRALAPTSLSAYIQCPFKFYLKHLLRIEDNGAQEETQNNVIGSVIHKTLQTLFNDYCGTLVSPSLFADVINPTVTQKMEDAIHEYFEQGLPDVGYNYLSKLNLDKLLDNFLRYQKKELSSHEISIIGLERLLTTTVEVDGISCKISGTADRIDCCDGVFRIIDYKTGEIDERELKVPGKVETLRDIPEKAMQLLIYKYLYLKNNPQPSENVSAAIFGLRYRQVCFELKVEYEPLNKDFMGTMEEFLTMTMRSLLDRSTPFSQPTDTRVKPCHFCNFKAICANTEAGALLVGDR
ncbi:MAG: PD-(D/E)XK nuclease family protein [Bacteroidales bacterium]|nr:PD-(D/E)XK nuclease family protein [Bacteroidales bacterium]